MRLTLRRLGFAAAVAVPAIFALWFVAWPVAAILQRGLAPDGSLDLGALGEVFTSDRLRDAAVYTVWMATASALLALAVGLPLAWALARLRFRGASLVRALVVVPFALPTVVVAGAFSALFGRGGPLGGLGFAPGTPAIVLANVCFNVSVVVLVVGAHWSSLDPRVEDAARVLGAAPWRVAREVTLPLLAPAVIAASAIVFLFCATSFGVVRVLGGPTQATVETEIYRLAVGQFRLDRAGALAIVQLVAVGLALLVAGRAQARATVVRTSVSGASARRAPAGVGERLVLGASVFAGLLVTVGPILALVVRSVRVDGVWDLSAYRSLATDNPLIGDSPLGALQHSLAIATVATLISVVVGGLASIAIASWGSRGRHGLDALLALPLGVSAVTLGYGFLVALDRPVELRTSWLLVPIAHAALAIPFVVRSTVPAIRAIDPHLREAAALGGATPARVWWEVDFPLVRRAFAVAAAFAAAISLGEFGATSFVARAGSPTAPVAIGRLLGRPGSESYQSALALAVLLMAVTALVVALSDRFGRAGGAG